MKRWGMVALAARLVLAGVFLVAGLPKLLDPGSFAQAIANYRILPDALVGPVAVVLPGIEVVCAVALAAGVMQRGALVAIQGMLVVFLVALVQAVLRGIDTSCGCFGATPESAPVGWGEVLRDVGLLGLGVVAWPRALSPDDPEPPA